MPLRTFAGPSWGSSPLRNSGTLSLTPPSLGRGTRGPPLIESDLSFEQAEPSTTIMASKTGNLEGQSDSPVLRKRMWKRRVLEGLSGSVDFVAHNVLLTSLQREFARSPATLNLQRIPNQCISPIHLFQHPKLPSPWTSLKSQVRRAHRLFYYKLQSDGNGVGNGIGNGNPNFPDANALVKLSWDSPVR